VATGAASVTDAGGRELSQRGPGAYFGESSLLSGELTMATVTAGAFGCSALSLDADAFQRLLGPSGEAHVQVRASTYNIAVSLASNLLFR